MANTRDWKTKFSIKYYLITFSLNHTLFLHFLPGPTARFRLCFPRNTHATVTVGPGDEAAWALLCINGNSGAMQFNRLINFYYCTVSDEFIIFLQCNSSIITIVIWFCLLLVVSVFPLSSPEPA